MPSFCLTDSVRAVNGTQSTDYQESHQLISFFPDPPTDSGVKGRASFTPDLQEQYAMNTMHFIHIYQELATAAL